MLHRILAVAALTAALGCADRAPLTEPDGGAPAAASLANLSKRPEALAKIVAKGLRNAAFRAYLKAQLDASPYREHKLQFQTFLAREQRPCATPDRQRERGERRIDRRAGEGGDRARGLHPRPRAAGVMDRGREHPRRDGLDCRRPADRVRCARASPSARSQSATDNTRTGRRARRNGLLADPEPRRGMLCRLQRRRWRPDRGRRSATPARSRSVHDQKPFRTRL